MDVSQGIRSMSAADRRKRGITDSYPLSGIEVMGENEEDGSGPL